MTDHPHAPREAQVHQLPAAESLPLADLEAERAILSSCLIDHRAAALVAHLDPADFYDLRHRYVFEAILGMFRDHVPIEPVTVHSECKRLGTVERAGGLRYLARLMSEAGSSLSVPHYAATVARLARVRRGVAAADRALRALQRGEAEEGARLLGDGVAALAGVDTGDEPVSLGEAAARAFAQAETAREHGKPPGIPTRLASFDNVTGGLSAPRLYVVAGRPSHGKTAFAVQIGVEVARQGHGVAMFSLEMGAVELATRQLAAKSAVSAQSLDRGEHSITDVSRLTRAVNDMQGLPFWIDDRPGLRIGEIASRARYLHARHGLKVVIVDYLQLAKADHRHANREAVIAEISRGLKAMAKELHVAVIAVAQLNRSVDSRGDHRPMVSDLRGSGQIEQDADLIGFVFQPSKYPDLKAQPGEAEFIVRKNRQGTCGTLRLAWDGPAQTFTDDTAAPW